MTSPLPAPTAPPRPLGDTRLRALCLAALGVVYADIGTSPLYAIRECFTGAAAVTLTEPHVLGVLSLVFWSLVFLVSILYLALILRVDNEGEGGILALSALVARDRKGASPAFRAAIMTVGLFGAALLYGDGILTPAISVLASVEGLEVAAPTLSRFVLPLSVAILVGLFAIQRRGTSAIGALFGPVTLVWFVVIGLLGLAQILATPAVLAAIDPRYGLALLTEGGTHTFLVLGPVFLVITGAETLYADLGHFGRRPIQLAWNVVVLPALLLNYFGQGALLLSNPAARENPFFHLAPPWLTVPLVVLAAAATVIASQGNISEVFSLTRQGVLMGYLPRVEIRHTSADEMGQVYLPGVNWALLGVTVLLVLGAGSSSRLASAYGVNVATTVLITACLSFFAMRDLWGWRTPVAALVAGSFVAVAALFFAANLAKVTDGGWVPLGIGLGIYLLMTTWKRGREVLAERLRERCRLDQDLSGQLSSSLVRVPGTAVYLTGLATGLPPALTQTLRHMRSLHERVVFLTLRAEARPFVPEPEQLEVTALRHDVSRVVVHHGFLESPGVEGILGRLSTKGLAIDPGTTVYVLGRETLVHGADPGLAPWRKALFCAMARNALMATSFYGLPPEQVLEIGIQVEI